MTRLSSSQQINAPPVTVSPSYPAPTPPPLSSSITVTGKYVNNATPTMGNIGPTRVSSGGVTVTTISPPRLPRPLSQGPLTLSMGSQGLMGGVTVTNPTIGGPITINSAIPSPPPLNISAQSNEVNVSVSGPATVTTRRNTSVTLLNAGAASQRMSVFEPYPMRDTVQHFCEKHLDKIKAYMDKVSVRIPPPAKCTIEGKFFEKLLNLTSPFALLVTATMSFKTAT